MMNRLLQGDTGSGKTIVAFILTMGVISSGHQVALMAPTALLAKQHYKKAKAYFEPFDVKVHLLTGHTSKAEREQIKQELIKDEALFVIGTHALFSDDISYKKLGLIITDEQHRFGVRQRQALRNKGQYPDVLYMSATPIPRTLAISVFGDMDLTTIKHKPAARKKVHTKLFNKEDLRLVYNLMEQELANNHQIYVVTPLILESVVNQEKANAQDVYQQLKKVFKDYKVGLVHGKIETEEKERMMDMFYHHEIDILVSTTVIEVGVDHANATMMVVFDSDQFGLSQLHQLRGRVGRGDSESYALLLVQNHESFDRLRVLEESDDGFYLSEKDLEMRGPGQFFGAKQSGVLSFNNASIIEDFHIFLKAKEDAQNIIKNAEDHRDLIDKIKQEIEQQKYDELWYNE
jgi:ATP-dependent DNA helicase RecG